jgi:predicted small integral membrane protein DUF2165
LRKGHWVIEARIAKIVMAGSLATFAFIVTFDNITDYYTNFEFVRHVLSMDTIFPGSTLLCRRVTCAALWNFAYWLIILGEGMTSLALGIAAVALFRHLTMELVDYARDVSHPPGARLLAGEKAAAILASYGEDRQKRPKDVTIEYVRPVTACLCSASWRDPIYYCSLVDPRDPREGSWPVRREIPLPKSPDPAVFVCCFRTL